MIRRGRFKFIISSSDGEMLFDLEADPHERDNLAPQGAYRAMLEEFRREAADKWDEPRLADDIRLSQRRRLLVREAMARGAPQRWNHGEQPGERVLWYRGEQGYNEWAFDYL